MDSEMRIEAFNTYLTADEEEGNLLQKLLRRVTAQTNPEDVRGALSSPEVAWTGWGW